MSSVKVVPNQLVVDVEKSICDREHIYTTNNLQALDYAASVLNGNEFKLYMYFAKNQHGYGFALSSKDFCEWANCSRATYNRAMETLKELKFLVPKEGKVGEWEFRDWGQEMIITNTRVKEQPFKDPNKFDF